MTTAQLLDQNVIRCKSPRQAIKYLLRHWSAVQSDPAAFAGWAVHYCHALYALTPKERKKQLAKAARITFSKTPQCERDFLITLLPYCTDSKIIHELSRILPTDERLFLIHTLQQRGDAAAQNAHFADAQQSYFAALYAGTKSEPREVLYWCCAVASLRCDRYQAAADLYREGNLHDEPPMPEALRGFADVLRVEVLLDEQQPQKAAEKLQAFIPAEAHTTDIDPHLQPTYARTLALLGNRTEAAESWLHAAEQQPARAVLCLRNAADLYRADTKYDDAVACYRRITEMPDTPAIEQAAAWIAIGLCEYARGNSEPELNCYQQALVLLPSDSPDAIRPLCYCGDTEFRLHRFAEGDAHYAQALQIALQCARLQRAAEIECEWADHLRECAHSPDIACTHYTSAIRLYHSLLSTTDVRKPLAMAYNGRSIALFNQKNYRGQISDTTAAITMLRALEPSADLYIRLSTCLRNRADSWMHLQKHVSAGRDYVEALHYYRKACELNPEFAKTTELSELLLCCGRVCEQSELFNDACVYYGELLMRLDERTQPLSDEDAEFYVVALLRRGQAFLRGSSRAFTRALADFDRAITLTENTSVSSMKQLRMVAFRQRGELMAAMEQFDLATQSFAAADALQKELTADNAANP